MFRAFKPYAEWFIQIENKDNHQRITVYENGLVYGTERGQVIGILTPETVKRLNGILTGKLNEKGIKSEFNRMNYLDLFRCQPYQKFNDNNLILRIRDDSCKQRNIKIVGHYITGYLLSIIKNPKNWI